VAGEENHGGYLAGALLALSGFTEDFAALIALRVLAGVGGAPVFIAGGAMAATLFASDSSKNALAIALYFGGAGAGLLLTALPLPPMLEIGGAASWPQTWQALGALSLVSLLPAWWGARQIIDAPGAAKATGSMENMVVITPYFPIVRNDGASIDQRQRTKPRARMRVMQVGGGVSGECVSHGSAPVSCDGF